MTNFQKIAYTAELLEKLDRDLECDEKSLGQVYDKTEELEPAEHWDLTEHRYVPVFNEDGTQKMTPKYAYRDKRDDEYTDEDREKLAIVKALRAKLEKLI